MTGLQGRKKFNETMDAVDDLKKKLDNDKLLEKDELRQIPKKTFQPQLNSFHSRLHQCDNMTRVGNFQELKDKTSELSEQENTWFYIGYTGELSSADNAYYLWDTCPKSKEISSLVPDLFKSHTYYVHLQGSEGTEHELITKHYCKDMSNGCLNKRNYGNTDLTGIVYVLEYKREPRTRIKDFKQFKAKTLELNKQENTWFYMGYTAERSKRNPYPLQRARPLSKRAKRWTSKHLVQSHTYYVHLNKKRQLQKLIKKCKHKDEFSGCLNDENEGNDYRMGTVYVLEYKHEHLTRVEDFKQFIAKTSELSKQENTWFYIGYTAEYTKTSPYPLWHARPLNESVQTWTSEHLVKSHTYYVHLDQEAKTQKKLIKKFKRKDKYRGCLNDENEGNKHKEGIVYVLEYKPRPKSQ